MIFQIDHVAFSSLNFEEDCKIFKSLGYKEHFIEKSCQNLATKKPMLKHFTEDLDVALLTCPSNFSIELLNHRSIDPAESYLSPIFDNMPENYFVHTGEQIINNIILQKATLKAFDLPVYIQNTAERHSFKFNKIIIKTENIKESVLFWEYFNFKPISIEKKFAFLQFNSMFTNDVYQIILKKEKNVNRPFYLDSKGFNCLAFITNSAEKEKESLEKESIKVTEMVKKFNLNKKLLNIFFAIGPSGEIIEVIGINN
ncbi:MAG: hypothetical protein CMD96_06885 [Gammaproteobacteria bacterium]|jgi:hypothetical protein|nr:hypothetical protein [Gammaproteobacteria bacterium]HJP17159.1 hypothetical protein [Nitrospinota bacterium]|tara:strand:+ start:4964 stop:5731 length:768 start_codon:yes stop_codon:yes gene_type:complete